jgi:hypothetical protein
VKNRKKTKKGKSGPKSDENRPKMSTQPLHEPDIASIAWHLPPRPRVRVRLCSQFKPQMWQKEDWVRSGIDQLWIPKQRVRPSDLESNLHAGLIQMRIEAR